VISQPEEIMFEGLDQIDWKNLGRHFRRDNSKVPDVIRNLISTDPETRKKARDFLLGPDQNWEYVSDTTSHIIPFILKLLNDPNTPDKDALLSDLSNILEHIWNSHKVSVHQMRRYVKTYDSLIEGKDIFTDLLNDVSIFVRTAAINVLKYLSSEFETILSEFLKHFYDELEENVQVALIMGMKTLLNPIVWDHYDYQLHEKLKENYLPVFKGIIETHPSHQVQVAAAKALVEIFSRDEANKEYASSKVSILLSEEFLAKSSSFNYPEQYPVEDKDFADAIMIMKDLIELNAETLLNLLREPTISALQTHLIINGLLSNTLGLDYFGAYWDDGMHIDYQRRNEGIFYVNQYSHAINLRTLVNYELNHPELNFERPIPPVIFAIAENDVLWKTPTNMFSFFYGLPDSREEFRRVFKLHSGS
jgi:hypothetical protein